VTEISLELTLRLKIATSLPIGYGFVMEATFMRFRTGGQDQRFRQATPIATSILDTVYRTIDGTGS
jgi:hypothetical protein